MKRWLLTAPVLAIMPVAWLAWGQADVPVDSEYRLRTTSELVLLDVAAEDARGKPVGDLSQKNFKIFENGKLQTITSFNHNDNPVSVGLVVDQSGSMRGRQKDVLVAALEFVRASNPQDEMFVVNFNERAALGLPRSVPFTDKIYDLENAISSTRAEGRTALNDAVVLALDHVSKGSKERKALLLISDGGDNTSTHTEAEMLSKAEEIQATIYTIGLFDYGDPGNPGLLRRVSKISGGETYLPEETSKLPEILSHIAHEIRSRYSIGYIPGRKDLAGGSRRIRVVAADDLGKHLVVHTRTRYRLPELEGATSRGRQQ